MIKNADMAEDMQQDAIDCATQDSYVLHPLPLGSCNLALDRFQLGNALAVLVGFRCTAQASHVAGWSCHELATSFDGEALEKYNIEKDIAAFIKKDSFHRRWSTSPLRMAPMKLTFD